MRLQASGWWRKGTVYLGNGCSLYTKNQSQKKMEGIFKITHSSHGNHLISINPVQKVVYTSLTRAPSTLFLILTLYIKPTNQLFVFRTEAAWRKGTHFYFCVLWTQHSNWHAENTRCLLNEWMNFPIMGKEKSSSLAHVSLRSKIFIPTEVQVECEITNLNKGFGRGTWKDAQHH